MVIMEYNLGIHDPSMNNVNGKNPTETTIRRDRSYKCNQCGFEFSQARNLRSHMKIHSSEKPYKCNQCNYTCARRSHLRSHKARRHSGERLIKCEQCEYSTCQEADLKRHLNTHSGEKSNKCD